MAALCQACQNIPDTFFKHIGKSKPDVRDIRVLGPRASHWPIELILNSAREGCPLCKLFAANLDASFLPPEVRWYQPTIILRGLLDSHLAQSQQNLDAAGIGPNQSICVHSSIPDDLSFNDFFLIPPTWRTLLAPVKSSSDAYELNLIKIWMQNCIEQHPLCGNENESFCPSRLLKLDAFRESKDIMLVEPRSCEGIRYTTLSHCWGAESSPKLLRTTTANMEAHRSHISFEDLPLTFKDAINLTRELGLSFLWIDSLCIIQDSVQDWEQEASLMGKVYANSHCTLAASSSPDSSRGCRRYTSASTVVPHSRYVDITKNDIEIRIFEKRTLDWYQEFNKGPLKERGWTLQERALSTRIVHFEESLILWECRTMKASSELPWFRMDTGDPPPLLLLNESGEASRESPSVKLREDWFKTVEDFTNRKLTKGRDRLPALDGLAQRGKDLGRGDYLAGLWRADMPSALLWRTGAEYKSVDCSRPTDYRAPSWSWASIQGPVMYDSQRISQADHLNEPERLTLECNFGNFVIKDAIVNHRTESSAGEISSGSIDAQGDLWQMTTNHGTPTPETDWRYGKYMLLRSSSAAVLGILCPDVVSEVCDGDEIYFVSIRDDLEEPDRNGLPRDLFLQAQNDSVRVYMGLGLVAVDGLDSTFRRVGLARYVRVDHSTTQTPRRFRII